MYLCRRSADGLSAYNNQRFEGSAPVAQYHLPFLSGAIDQFGAGFPSWPFYIRSDMRGNAYVFDGSTLTVFSAAHAQVYAVAWPHGPATLTLTDDESLMIMSGESLSVVFDAAMGAARATVNYTAFGASSCQFTVSPWRFAQPTPLADNRHLGLVCTRLADGASMAAVAVLAPGELRAPPAVLPLAFVGQAAFDSRLLYQAGGNAFVVLGTIKGTGAAAQLAVARVPLMM